MTTRDTPKAMLAAALHERGLCHYVRSVPPHAPVAHETDAAAILTALDGWTLVPSDEMTGTRALATALEGKRDEIERLTRELDAARTLAAAEYADAERLRAALRQISVWPGDRKLVASICEIALAPTPSEPKEAEHESTGTVARGTHPRGLPELGVSDVSGGATTRPPKPPRPPKDREWDGS